MKSNTRKTSDKVNFTFAYLSKWTAYFVGLLAVCLLAIDRQSEAVELIPIAQLFLQAAKISLSIEEKNKKPSKK